MEQEKDALKRRCPRLGNDVAFEYCRVLMDKEMPCGKIFDCWWEMFDVRAHLESILPAETFEKLLNAQQPKPKVLSILELIEAAKNRQK